MEEKDTIRVLVVDDVAETRENLRKLLSFAPDIDVVGAAASGREGVELSKELRPDIVLMDINMPGMDGIAATEAILQAVPTTQIVMLSVQGESDYLRRAMLAGARDFLTKPPSGDELMSTLRQVYETGKKRAAVMAPQRETAPQASQPRESREAREGVIIPFFSPKGGVGCTTLAVNTAIALQQRIDQGQRVALIDADFQFGDVGVMLNLSASRTIADLVVQTDELDDEMLSSVLVPHGSGLKVLLAPPHPETAESLLAGDGTTGGVSAFKTILEMVQTQFDIVVVDVGSRVDELALTVFDAAAMILLVVSKNIPAIKSARLYLELAGKLNYSADKMALVVNGADRRQGVRVDQIEQALLPAIAEVPWDEQTAISAANRGTPLLVRDENRPIAQSVIQIAEQILEQLAAEEEEEEKEDSMVPGTGRLRLGRLF